MLTDNERRMLDYCRNAMEAQRIQHDKDIRAMEKSIEALERLMDSKFEAQNQAVDAAHVAMQARFESVNEFRATLSDQTKTFVTRAVMDASVNELTRRVNSLENRMAGYDGRILGYSAGSAAVVLIIAIVMQLLNLGGG